MIQRHGDYLSVCVGIKNNTAQGRRCAVSTTLLRCPESGGACSVGVVMIACVARKRRSDRSAAAFFALYYQKMCPNTAQRRGICLLLKGILTLSSHCRLATRKMNDKAYNEPDESRKHPAEIHIK